MEELLEDLLFEEILPRLSVNCLMRLKLVSKQWHYLITADQQFIANHLCRQSETRELSLAVKSNENYNNSVLLLDHRRNSVEVVHQSVDIRYFSGQFKRHFVVGSCDGLVCLHLRSHPIPSPLVSLQDIHEAVALWNPETGEGRDISASPVLPCSFFYQRRAADQVAYGFGSDRNEKPRADYKVVRVLPTTPTELSFDVFSRNKNSWRRLENSLSGYTVSIETPHPVHLDGRLYFLILAVETGRRCVLSVDLRDDKFGVIEGLVLRDCSPSINCTAFPFPPRLVRWQRNCLAYLSGCGANELEFQLVLDSAGNVVKDAPLTPIGLSAPATALSDNFWKFCGVSRDRFLVLENESSLKTTELVVYDHATTSSVDRPRRRREVLSFSKTSLVGSPHDYVPSLVSVFGDERTKMEGNKRMRVADLVATFGIHVGLTKELFGMYY